MDPRHRATALLLTLGLLAVPGAASAAGSGGVTTLHVTTTTPAVTATTPAATTPAATTPAGTTTIQTGASGIVVAVKPRSSASSSGLSGGAILAAVIGGLLLLACLAWAVFRMRALEPQWLLGLRHSFAEAGYRASAAWAEFADWIRLGH